MSTTRDDAAAALRFLSDRYYHAVENDGEDNAARFALIEKAMDHAACPYCAGDMCARFDGLNCTHDTAERHGYEHGRSMAQEARPAQFGELQDAVEGLIALVPVARATSSTTWIRNRDTRVLAAIDRARRAIAAVHDDRP